MNITIKIKTSTRGYHLTGVVENELHYDIKDSTLEKCLQSFMEEVLILRGERL
jgi:hypothetical protein